MIQLNEPANPSLEHALKKRKAAELMLSRGGFGEDVKLASGERIFILPRKRIQLGKEIGALIASIECPSPDSTIGLFGQRDYVRQLVEEHSYLPGSWKDTFLELSTALRSRWDKYLPRLKGYQKFLLTED